MMAYTTLILFTVSLVTIPTVMARSHCVAYCDKEGYYQNGFTCSSSKRYCCGDLNTRFCCRNASADISDDYQEVYMCDRSSWWIYHWQVIIGMLASIIIILLFAACCCQCCSMCKRSSTNRSSRFSARGRSRSTGGNRDSSGGGNNQNEENTNRNFNPDSPYAFQPPSYDSLPKDPPKYDEVFVLSEMGQTNSGFEGDNAEPGPSSVNPSDANPETSVDITPVGNSSGRNSATSTTSLGSVNSDNLPSYEVAITRDQIQPEERHPPGLTEISVVHRSGPGTGDVTESRPPSYEPNQSTSCTSDV